MPTMTKPTVAELKNALSEVMRERDSARTERDNLRREAANLRRVVTVLSNDRAAALGCVELLASKLREGRRPGPLVGATRPPLRGDVVSPLEQLQAVLRVPGERQARGVE